MKAVLSHKLVNDGYKTLYKYRSVLIEFDSPVAMCFIYGCQISSMIDHNDLRPARYIVIDNRAIPASKAGILLVKEGHIVKSGTCSWARYSLIKWLRAISSRTRRSSPRSPTDITTKGGYGTAS